MIIAKLFQSIPTIEEVDTLLGVPVPLIHQLTFHGYCRGRQIKNKPLLPNV
jgi:hypothetical protein